MSKENISILFNVFVLDNNKNKILDCYVVNGDQKKAMKKVAKRMKELNIDYKYIRVKTLGLSYLTEKKNSNMGLLIL